MGRAAVWQTWAPPRLHRCLVDLQCFRQDPEASLKLAIQWKLWWQKTKQSIVVPVIVCTILRLSSTFQCILLFTNCLFESRHIFLEIYILFRSLLKKALRFNNCTLGSPLRLCRQHYLLFKRNNHLDEENHKSRLVHWSEAFVCTLPWAPHSGHKSMKITTLAEERFSSLLYLSNPVQSNEKDSCYI